jgi:hypothetical protein
VTYIEHTLASEEPESGAGRPERGGRTLRNLGRPAGLASLAVGALCLAAACGPTTSSASAPAASTGAPSPAQSATQASTPTPPAPAGPSATPGAPGMVTAGTASSAQVAAFTAAAQGRCGFTSSADILTNARVTNNGWGSATITARNPQDQGNSSMVFRLGSAWTYDTCGSDFMGSNIPQDVLEALRV